MVNMAQLFSDSTSNLEMDTEEQLTCGRSRPHYIMQCKSSDSGEFCTNRYETHE